ncbi:MAG: hypothetical protein KF795_28915 [Labilithrix sp.]|nr:hypothetical protein [Labilithrix sp.]
MRLRGNLAALLGAAAISLFCAPARAASPCVTAADEAQDLRGRGKLREARASLLVCASRSCNPVVRADCERWLKEVDEATPSIVVRAVDSRGRDVLGARVTIDGAAIKLDGSPVEVDPGRRVLRAKTRAGDVAEQTTLVALGEKARVVELRFDRPLQQDGARLPSDRRHEPPTNEGTPGDRPPAGDEDARAPSNALPIALAAVGGVALGAFGYFELSGQAGYADLESGCYRTAAKCAPAEVDPVRQQFVFAGISLGVSLVALGAAAIVYFTSKPSSTARLDRVLTF